MKKTALALVALLLTPSFVFAQSTILNYPHLYRGMRSLGMGGAYTAVGGDAEAVFYNPATLSDMGFQIDLVNPLVEVDNNLLDLHEDINDALDLDTDIDRTDALLDIARDNAGDPLHGRAALFPSVAVKNYVIGYLGQGTFDARLHNQSSRIVEVLSGYESGPVAGFSFGAAEGLRLGLSAKYISRTSVNEDFSVNEVAADDFELTDYDTTNSDYSFDAGLIYDLPFFPGVKPKLGISVLDITDLDFDEGGKIPQRINVGASITAKVPVISEVIVAADYEDLTQEFDQDDSVWKRVHLGAEAEFLDRHILLRVGINQGYPAYGAEIDVWLLRLGYTYYEEEMGGHAGQDKDERHLVQVSLGW